MKRSRKLVSILLTLAMLATLLVPMATPAIASSTYSANSVANVSANNWYNDGYGAAGALPAQSFNRIMMELPAGALGPAGAETTFRLSLPIDYIADVEITPAANSVSFTNQVAALGAAATRIGMVGGGSASPGWTGAGNNVAREWDITLESTGSADKGILYIDFYGFRVPSGKTGDVTVTIDAPPGSPVSNGQLVIARIGTGSVSLAMDDVNTLTTAGGRIADLLIKEDRSGSLAAGATSIKIKLPNGFTWQTPDAVAAAPRPAVTTSLIWSTGDATVMPVVPNAAAGVAGNLTLQDSGRTLCIGQPNAALSASATYYRISGLWVNIDETVAKTGDIAVTISGDSTITTSSLNVGKLSDYSVSVAAFGDAKEVKAGRADEEIGKIAIEETVASSLVGNRTITLQLTGGAKWNAAGFPRIDAANSKNTNALAWSYAGSLNDTIKATVTASASAAKYVLEKGKIDLSGAATGDIKVIVGGTAGASGEVVVAKVVNPVTISVDKVKDVAIGQSGQALSDIIVAEASKEAIASANAAGAFTPFTIAGGPAGGLYLEFPYGVNPSLPTSVEVIEGDLVVDPTSVGKGVTNDGRWAIGVTVRSTSSTPSKVAFKGIKVTVDRSVAEGPVRAAVKGNVVQTVGLFPGATSIANTVVANCVTPASGEQKTSASFVIGSTSYKVGADEKTMDVAPYIKNGRTYLPVRYVAEALGVTSENILWDGATNKVTLLKGDKVVQLTIGSKAMLVNGVSISMDVPAEITSGRTMLPFRFIAQALGATVGWDEATQTVTLN